MEGLGIDTEFIQALWLAVLLSGIPLVSSMIVGLVLSILQAATQIQEQTLSFVPKVATVCTILFFSGPWMSSQIVEYCKTLFDNLPQLAVGP